MSDKPIETREELLAQARSTPATVRTHEQNVMAVLAIVRRKVHPDARVHRAVDGTTTITIPPPGASI